MSVKLRPGMAARRAVPAACISVMATLAAAPAQAHGQAPIGPDAFWQAFEPDPLVLALLLAMHLLYGRGAFRLRRQAGTRSPIRRRHIAAFAGGELVLALALASPLEALSGTLFSAHMVQHMLLIAVAPPLLLLGRPDAAFLSALPRTWRRRVAGAFGFGTLVRLWRGGQRPLPATALHGVVIWAWHAPPAFEAALSYPVLHDIEHLTFFGSALLFWRGLARARRSAAAAAAGAAASLLTLIHGGFLGALISFAPRPLYPGYVWTGLWGLTALEDQQLAGLIMWVPAGLIYLGAGLLLASRVIAPPRPVQR